MTTKMDNQLFNDRCYAAWVAMMLFGYLTSISKEEDQDFVLTVVNRLHVILSSANSVAIMVLPRCRGIMKQIT